MSKCHVRELQNLWEGILEDASHSFPTLRDEFERDLARLQRIVAHRGIRVFLEDLPEIGKHLDQCLACGQYNLSGLPLTKRYSNKVVIPKFLRGLYLLIFHDSGQLKEDCNVEALFFVRQLTKAFKKGNLACSAKANEKEVVEFFAVDKELPEPERFWETQDDEKCIVINSSTHPIGECCGDSDKWDSQPSGRPSHRISQNVSLCQTGGEHPKPGCSTPGDRLALSRANDSHRGSTTGSTNGNSIPGVECPVGSSEAMATRGVKIYEGFTRSPLYARRVASQPPLTRRRLSVLLARLDFVSNLVTATLGPYDPSLWWFRHGPGAVSEYSGPTNKYYWTNWSDTLESEYPIADCGFHSHSSWADRVHTGREISSHELRSRLLCVPKTYSKPRLIAAEPSANQWCQQNARHYFDARCEGSWINDFCRFHDQSLNQRLCTLGSRDGSLATVDLSAASDRVSCHIVGQMFRANPRLLNCLRASRTHTVEQEVASKLPRALRLRKYSTMGNATTFPVESLIFLSVTLAAVLTHRGLRGTLRNVKQLAGEVAVYGDDIIVPVDSRELLVEALEVFDFKVNAHKSFWTGKFRESCGVDAYSGENITPAYWRNFNNGKPAALASTVETRNNFYKKFLLSAADRLASTIPRGIPTVHMSSGAFGLKSFLGEETSGFKHRENPHLQRTEVLVMKQKVLQNKTAMEGDSALLQYFTEAPDPFTKWESGVPQRPKNKVVFGWVPLSDLGKQFVEGK